MSSFILDLETVAENDSPELDELITTIQAGPEFIRELKRTFGSRLDSEHGLKIRFPLSKVCEQAWVENGDSELVQRHMISIAERLQPVQKSDKGLLFHSSDSEVLIVHYHENEGWVNDSGELINGDREPVQETSAENSHDVDLI